MYLGEESIRVIGKMKIKNNKTMYKLILLCSRIFFIIFLNVAKNPYVVIIAKGT